MLALFGSIAGAESVLLALDDDLRPVVAMAEAPHGTAPSLMGKNVANPMAMLLACAAVLDHAAQGDAVVAAAAAAIRRATLGAAADGIRTFDLGGEASTSDVVDEVLARLRGSGRALNPLRGFIPSGPHPPGRGGTIADRAADMAEPQRHSLFGDSPRRPPQHFLTVDCHADSRFFADPRALGCVKTTSLGISVAEISPW